MDRRTANSGSAISVTYTRYEEDRDGVDVTYRNRKTAALERLRVMRAINCTVPRWIAAEFENSLLNNLLRQKLVRPDPLFLGLDTSEHGALVSAHGEPSDFLYIRLARRAKEASGKPLRFQKSGFRRPGCQHCYFPPASEKGSNPFSTNRPRTCILQLDGIMECIELTLRG